MLLLTLSRRQSRTDTDKNEFGLGSISGTRSNTNRPSFNWKWTQAKP
jgi:hypothetical protein